MYRCLINALWYTQWKIYVNYDTENTSIDQEKHPGQIDNAVLLHDINNDELQVQIFMLLSHIIDKFIINGLIFILLRLK